MVIPEAQFVSRELALHVKGLLPPTTVIVHLKIEEHVGGERDMQVYRAQPTNADAAFAGLLPSRSYCVKVFHAYPRWSGPVYALRRHLTPGRQVPRSVDCAGRVAALWQFVIRAAATQALSGEACVPKIYATFYDQNLRAFGFIEEWVQGRPWRLEIDDHLFDRSIPGPDVDYKNPDQFPSEYTAKRFFLARMERLLREIGADGLADHYCWKNWNSPRHAILRDNAEWLSYRGLTAIHFVPASYQVEKLRTYVEEHASCFDGAELVINELEDLLQGVSSPEADKIVMPKSNPAAAHLLWAIPESRRLPRHIRIHNAWANAIRGVKRFWRLLTRADSRSAWLLERVENALTEGRLSEEEAERIRTHVDDPYIQVYLKCLMVHICMLPVTNVVVLVGGAGYAWIMGLTVMQGIQIVLAGLAIFAILPFSPGSIARGLYVVWVTWRRKEINRFRVALFFSFWRYVGFLAFPLQMVRTFPALARFMASHWATRAIHLVPKIGKHGGRLEYGVFDLCFNLPLTLGQRKRNK